MHLRMCACLLLFEDVVMAYNFMLNEELHICCSFLLNAH